MTNEDLDIKQNDEAWAGISRSECEDPIHEECTSKPGFDCINGTPSSSYTGTDYINQKCFLSFCFNLTSLSNTTKVLFQQISKNGTISVSVQDRSAV